MYEVNPSVSKKEPHEFMEKNHSVSSNPTKFGGLRHYGSGDEMFFVCCTTLQDHTIKGSCDFMGSQVDILISLVALAFSVFSFSPYLTRPGDQSVIRL